jgi:hypothetical protein
LLAVGVVIAALAASSASAGSWSNYAGPNATFYNYGGLWTASTGYNNWTDNRVYRPTGHPFYLSYENGSGFHYSTDNYYSNPFEWPPGGYSKLYCTWDYPNDPFYSSVYPVTCQKFI